jgi:hypothetical protein
LPTFLCSLFFEVAIMVLPLVFLQDLIAALERLCHLQVDVKFHVVHGHLDNEVSFIDLLILLLGLVS